VSRYFQDREVEGPEGRVVIPGHYARFSIWVIDRQVCAVSLPDGQGERLARFLLAPAPDGEEVHNPSLN
jgi:hypothetical protein